MFRQIRRVAAVGLVMAVVAVWIPPYPASGTGTMSIVGQVNDEFQVVTDNGQVYEIMTDDKGEELIGQAGKRVKVTGEVVEEGADRSIKVLSYKVLE